MMKRLLLFLFFPLTLFVQARNAGQFFITGPFSESPTCSQNAIDSNTHNGDVYRGSEGEVVYECSDGSRVGLASVTTSQASLQIPSVSTPDTRHDETNLDADIRRFGAYAAFSSGTCKTISGSPRLKIAAASNFRDGEYATCYNAGPDPTVTTPPAPTVTPSFHAGGMTVTTNPGDGTNYGYCIVAEGPNNDRSACSPVGSTTGGATANQLVGYTFTGNCTRSVQTVTCTTSSTHSLIPGIQIWVYGMADPTFNGNWVTIAPTSGRTVTWKSGWDTQNGATTSSVISSTSPKGYNVWAWALNKVSWVHDAIRLRTHIYGSNCSSTCNWVGQSVLDYWYDFGPTMTADQSQPPYIPTTAPSSSAHQHFTFKICSGGGTTTLLACSNAGASVSGNGIVSDAGPALLAAATAAKTRNGDASEFWIPNTDMQWQVNSYTNFCSVGSAKMIIDATNLVANQPLACLYNIEGRGANQGLPFFGFGNYPVISGIGFPLLYTPTQGPHWRHIAIVASAANGGLAYYGVNATNSTFDDVFWATSQGSYTDYLGQQVIFDGVGRGASSFYNSFSRNSFETGVPGTSYTGASPVPTIVCTSQSIATCGDLKFRAGWFVNRSSVDMDMQGSTGQLSIQMDQMDSQNAMEPVLQTSGPSSGQLAAIIRLTDVFPADYATPIFVDYNGINGVVIIDNVGAPSGGQSILSGNPLLVVSRNTSMSQLGTNSNVTSTTYGSISNPALSAETGGFQASQKMDSNVQIGNNYALISGANTVPAAPTCSVASAGPPYTLPGTWFFTYAPVWQNGAIGTNSLSSNSCTSNGTSQQITITVPAAIAGVEGYAFYRNNIPSPGYLLSCKIPNTSGLNYTWTGSACGPSAPSFPGGGPAGIQNGTVYAQTLNLGAIPAPTGAATNTQVYMDSTVNWPSFKPNGNKAYAIPGINGPVISGHNLCADGTRGAYVDCPRTQPIDSGTITLEPGSIEARTCSKAIIVPAADVNQSDVIAYSFTAQPSGAYTTGLFIQSFVTLGKVNFLVCNPTNTSLTPPAARLNWRVTR